MSGQVYPPRGDNNPEVVHLSGRFALSSSPARVAGRGYTLSYAATGLFSIITDFPWFGAVGGGLEVLSATLTDRVQIVSVTPATRTIVLQFQSAGAANAGTTAKEIWFDFKLQQKGIPLL